MATGKITVAAPNRKGAVGRQQEAYNRSLEQAARYSERSDRRATDAAQNAYAQAGQFQLENMARVAQQTDAANERFLRSRLEQFEDARKVENQLWKGQQELAISQRKQDRETQTSIKNQLNRYKLGVRVQNLENIAKISDTANKVVQDVYKKHIEGLVEEEMAVGMAEASQFGLNPQQAQVIDQATSALSKAAIDEGVANDAVAEVDIVQAEDQRRTSPVLTGWRAYGRALGRAQAAKGMWHTALDVWIHSEDPLIPDPERFEELISPRELARRGPAGTMAALSAGNAFLMKKFGLDGINPALIAKELGETVNGVTAAVARNIITEDRAIDKQNQIEEITSRLSTSYRAVDASNSFAVTEFANTQVNLLAPIVGGRGKANEVVVEQLLSVAVANLDTPFLGALEVANISNEDPSLGTWGDRYADSFDRAASAIIRRESEMEQARQADVDELLVKVEQQYRSKLAAAGSDAEAIKTANQEFRQRLYEIGKEGGSDKAIERFVKEQTKPLTATDQAYSILLEHFKKTGQLPGDNDLQEMVDDGRLSQSEARDLAQRRGPNLGAEMAKDMHAEIKSLTSKVYIEDVVQTAGIHSIGKLGSFGQEALNTLADETALYIQGWINSQPEGTVTTAAIRAEARKYAKQAVTDRNYQIRTRETAVTPSEALSGKKPEVIFEGPVGTLANRIVVSAANPRSPSGRSFDLRGERPEVVNGFMTANDVVLNDQEINESIEALKGGRPLPNRVTRMSQVSGIPAGEIVQRQATLNSGQALSILPFSGNTQAQQAQTILPSESSMLVHPNVPSIRSSRAVQRIETARNIQMQRAATERARQQISNYNAMSIPDAPASWTESSVGQRDTVVALKPFLDLLAEGESLSAGNYNAVAGSRTGVPGLSNMTFAEARAAGGNNAIGRYQFIPETMRAAMEKAGLKMTDKFSPENQDRLAASWILNGQRPRLSAYIRGESNDLAGAVNDAATEWAALSMMTGAGRYDGDGRNKATISSGRVSQALQQVRRSYLDARNSQTSQTSGFQSSATLRKLGGQIRYSAEKDANGRVIPGLCTTNVLNTLEANGIPNPPATGNDRNNPRGAAVQFIRNYGWKSLEIPGSSRITLDSTYGKAEVNKMSLSQYQQAVGRGQIPSGALVFQTKHSSWNANTGGSSGFDVAIARNGGSQLFNGMYNPSAMYGSSTTHVFVLVPSN